MTILRGRSIELWVEPRDGAAAVNPVMRALLDDLTRAGASVGVRVPEWEVIDADDRPRTDLILLKSATAVALALAVADEAAGTPCLNAARTTLRVHDKAATIARLAAAGLPVPETWLVDRNGMPHPAAIAASAWVSKPVRGVHGHGVVMHDAFPAALDTMTTAQEGPSYLVDDGVRLVQRRVGGDEPDVKVYVAHERCFAASKAFSRDSYTTDSIEPRALDAAESGLIRAVGEALDLRLYGVDLRYDDGRPAIIDANPFPGYRGFFEAVPALRQEIERALEEAG